MSCLQELQTAMLLMSCCTGTPAGQGLWTAAASPPTGAAFQELFLKVFVQASKAQTRRTKEITTEALFYMLRTAMGGPGGRACAAGNQHLAPAAHSHAGGSFLIHVGTQSSPCPVNSSTPASCPEGRSSGSLPDGT